MVAAACVEALELTLAAQHLQDERGAADVVLAEVFPVAAPFVLTAFGQPAFHGVSVDVADRLEQLRVSDDGDALEPALEEMTYMIVPVVEVPGVGPFDPFHERRYVGEFGAQQKVNVVSHEAPRDHLHRALRSLSAQEVEKRLSVKPVFEDKHPPLATDDDMVKV